MSYMKFVFYFLLMIFFIGCGSSPKVADGSSGSGAESSYDDSLPKGISINYASSKILNEYDSQPHVIPLVVYQLNNINSFEGLKKDKAGIIKLLSASKFDKSVMSVNKYFISPNETKELLLERAEQTTWVCLVAGYYDMEPTQSTLKYKIPQYSSLKFWKSESKQKFLTIKVYFDKSSINQRQE